MIGYIKGTLEYSGQEQIIIDNNGMGYELKIPLSIIEELPQIGEEIKVFTYLYVREDAMVLYGFISPEDLEIFKLLLTVSGVGPKGALSILSALSPYKLRIAIVTGDDASIAKAPGIGKKTAQRLIIDLKDKIKIEGFSQEESNITDNNENFTMQNSIMEQAIMALITLGYSRSEATRAVKNFRNLDSVEEIIKNGLRQLSII